MTQEATAPAAGSPPDVFGNYRTARPQGALFELSPTETRYDELFDATGTLKPHWADPAAGLSTRGHPGMQWLRDRVRRLVDTYGITYNETSVAEPGKSVPPSRWQLDGVPLVLAPDDWATLEAGLTQRSRVLDALLADLYGPMSVVRSGLLPPQLVFGHPGYLRAAHGITVPGPHQLFLHGCDVSRSPTGSFRVNADWTQAPSGAGYALADRRVISRALPDVFQQTAPRPISSFAQTMRLALIDAAPDAAENPVVVVLSPGTHSETAFDQAYLASVLGFPLVESADLTVRDGKLWMRSLGTLKRVDVVLRRVDAAFADPLDLRADSRLGVVGLVEVLRRGAVSVVNTLGSGVLENAALPGFLPQLSRSLLGEELLLESTPTYWAGDDLQKSHLLANLGSLVVKSTVGTEVQVGRLLTAAARETLAAQIEAEPWKWVGQEPPQFSVAPIESSASAVRSAPVAFRMFAVAQRAGFTAMVGGLGQVMAENPTSLALHSIAAKDVWVRPADRGGAADATGPIRLVPPPESLPVFHAAVADVVSSPRVLSDLFWMGRYAERAEDTARLLIAVRDRQQEYRHRMWLDGSDSVTILLDALAEITGSMDVNAHDLQRTLTADKTRAGSLAQSVDRLGYAARAVRDQLSNDTWTVLSTVDAALAEFATVTYDDGSAIGSVQSAVLTGMLSLSGLGAESMVHDPGWYLMDIGKRLERGLQLTALLGATLDAPRMPSTERMVIESVLAASESSVIYARRNRGVIRLAAVAQLLLFDEGNPRSLVYQLDRLKDDLHALPEASGSSRAERLAEEMSAQLRRADPADLETVGPEGLRTDLVELLDGIHASLRSLSEIILATQLSMPQDIQPLWGLSLAQVLP
ncbi:circularly permuted type 2 ATP-grasp protein [Antrihabitans cavernicola]|uniref:Uncharacterized protein n=1 Tax=Antrihabitans cavernicola TaxID=2495913 RepID=A0A5A7SFW0_9NOCA|nr:circularly permuted type 2 ATP-grasp protein [Spelaeibacter cavernicola]KAA0024706.1 hypothetical protein FOY51_01840 [Spelaeibacter cavernicola]